MNRFDFKGRVDWNVSNRTKAYVRIAQEGETAESPRGVWWLADVVALPTPNIGENRGLVYAGNVVTVLSPTMTNEALVSYSRLRLDNTFADPSLLTQGAGRIDVSNGIFPANSTSPYLPTDILHGWGGNGQVGQLWTKANDVYAHNDALQFSDKLTKLAGAHGLKFGIAVERGQKQQNFQNLEAGQLWFGADNTTGTGHSGADMLVGHVGQFNQGTARTGNPSPGMPFGEFRDLELRRVRPGQLEAALESHARVRRALRQLEQQRRAGRPGRSFHTVAVQLHGGIVPGSGGPTSGSTASAMWRRGARPTACWRTCTPFAMPCVNVAWDIAGDGNNVVRGGYGMFCNRNMGNVDQHHLRMAPTSTRSARTPGQRRVGNGGVVTYDTIDEPTLANRVGSVAINSLTPDSIKWPKTYSFSA